MGEKMVLILRHILPAVDNAKLTLNFQEELGICTEWCCDHSPYFFNGLSLGFVIPRLICQSNRITFS